MLLLMVYVILVFHTSRHVCNCNDVVDPMGVPYRIAKKFRTKFSSAVL